jgi:hypothetical protein
MRPVFHEALRLEIKSADSGKRYFRGVATTSTPDHAGDIVEPAGAEFSLPLPLLRQHRQAEPIGEVFQATATETGIEVEARGLGDGRKLPYLAEAWEQIAARLVKGLSVGFQPLDYDLIRDKKGNATGGLHFKRWRWVELSAVTVPMNPEAGLSLRSLARGDLMAAHDRDARAALIAGALSRAEPARDLQRNRAAVAFALADRALKGFSP